MAELQRLSSKQQILLNLYQVSDEQQRGSRSDRDANIQPVNVWLLRVCMKTGKNWKPFIYFGPGEFVSVLLSAVGAPNNLMSESNQFTRFN